MIDFTLDNLYTWLNAFWWPFERMLALIGTAPIFSEPGTPSRVKIGLAALLAVAVAPALPAMPDIPPASFAGLLITGQQIIIGMAMGMAMKFVFAIVQMAGEFIGLQMGLSFASFFDPGTGANTAVLARIMNRFALLLFLVLDGHLLIIGALVQSFQTLPVAEMTLNPNGWGVLLNWGSQIMELGLLLALPLVASLLAVNLALGILNRTASQLSIFSVGFPITMTVGILLLTVILPHIGPYLERIFEQGFEAMSNVLTGFATGRLG